MRLHVRAASAGERASEMARQSFRLATVTLQVDHRNGCASRKARAAIASPARARQFIRCTLTPSMPAVDLPPPPRGLKGRATELATLAKTIEETAPTRLALVGAGGSGKSMLTAALAHRVAPFFERRASWFRVGSWDFYTLTEMLALRFGLAGGDERVPRLNEFFARTGPRLIVLDNHEDDRAMARLLDAFTQAPVTFVITARRCLLAGVLIFPVTAPMVTAGRSAFPRVARLTRMLRWNPLALDIADGIASSGAATVAELGAFLEQR